MGFELLVHVDLGNATHPSGQVTSLDKGVALARRAKSLSVEAGAAEVTREGGVLWVAAGRANQLRPWLAAAGELGLRARFVMREVQAGLPPRTDSAAVSFVDDYARVPASARFGDEGIALDLPLEDGSRLAQALRGHGKVVDDGSMHDIPLPASLRQVATRWLIRTKADDDATALREWIAHNGGSAALADVACEVEAAYGGLRSLDRLQRFGGMQMVTNHRASGSIAEHPLVNCPLGEALLIAVRDIDTTDTLVALAKNRSVWRYDFGWDRWLPSATHVDGFLARLAVWPHTAVAPRHVVRQPLPGSLAAALHLEMVPEGSDDHGTLHAGDEAVVFERVLPEIVVTHAQPLTERAEQRIREGIG